MRAAERKRDRACDRACRIADQIAEMPAYTLAGLMAKARCITLLYKDAEIVIDGSATGSDLALSIAADLVEMGKATA